MNLNISNCAPTLSYSVVPSEEFAVDHGNFLVPDMQRPEQADGESTLDDLLRKLKLGKLKHIEATQKQSRLTPVKKQRESEGEKVASALAVAAEEKLDDKHDKAAPRWTPRPSRTRRGGTRIANRSIEPVQIDPPRTFWRRESISSFCDSSVSSVDTVLTPKKKKIYLRPHRSSDLYEAQRNDEELRELLQSKTTNTDFVVAKVHGKSLVVYRHERRVYIPASLRPKTMKYYRKNFKYSSKQRMAESCYWPNMERDQRRAQQWKVCVTEPGKDPKFIYDSDE